MEKTIYLKRAKAGYKLPVGCSQWWGNPDLPHNIEYPTYIDGEGIEREYVFICQLNLEEIALKNPDTSLPHKGLLSIFAKIGYYLGKEEEGVFTQNVISDTEAIKVLYFEETQHLEEVILMDVKGQDSSPEEMRMVYSETLEKYDEEHGLFIFPAHRTWDTWPPPYEQWQILFQLDSCEGEDFHLNLMNGGVLDLLISPKDLADHRFENVRAIIVDCQ